jgi:hypothetical protein
VWTGESGCGQAGSWHDCTTDRSSSIRSLDPNRPPKVCCEVWDPASAASICCAGIGGFGGQVNTARHESALEKIWACIAGVRVTSPKRGV